MTPRTLSTRIGPRTRTAGLAAIAAIAVIAAVVLTTGSSPADAATPAAVSATDKDQLRKDLREARGLEGAARRDALEKIRKDAAAGVYGDRVADRLDRRGDRRSAVLALLPDALAADLEEARAAEPDDRRAMVEDIREKALDGGYGDDVQQLATTMEDHWKDGRAGVGGPAGLGQGLLRGSPLG